MSSLNNPSQFSTAIRDAIALDLVVTNQEQAFYKTQILENFNKKFIGSDVVVDTAAEAIKLFRQVNDRMGALNQAYPTLSVDWHSNVTLRRARYFMHAILGDGHDILDRVFAGAKHSAGTTIGVPYTDTSIEAKWKWDLTGTTSVCRLWEHYRNWDYDLYTQCCNLNETNPNRVEVVFTEGSRSATVPKSSKIDRYISVEPTLNMFFQQGLAAVLNERLKLVGLHVTRDQEKHRRLACEGSVSGNWATVDFSSASDSLSLALCHFLLPKVWYSALFCLRSHRSRIGDEMVELSMMSTMGNATTFPLETLVFLCIAQSSVETARGNPALCPWKREVHVYGDDCIVPSVAAGVFVESCSLVGLTVNEGKTFLSGPFRESCGGDFYRGREVRPFYLKSLPTSRRKCDMEAYLYITINGVIRAYKKYFGHLTYLYDKHLLRFLLDRLSKVTRLVKFVPETFPEDSGITSLHDRMRFLRAYRIKPARVGVSEHGNLDFNYLRYEYPRKRAVHDGVRYASLLKKHTLESQEEHSEEAPLRKGGFYVERRIMFSGGILLYLSLYPTGRRWIYSPSDEGQPLLLPNKASPDILGDTLVGADDRSS